MNMLLYSSVTFGLGLVCGSHRIPKLPELCITRRWDVTLPCSDLTKKSHGNYKLLDGLQTVTSRLPCGNLTIVLCVCLVCLCVSVHVGERVKVELRMYVCWGSSGVMAGDFHAF